MKTFLSHLYHVMNLHENIVLARHSVFKNVKAISLSQSLSTVVVVVYILLSFVKTNFKQSTTTLYRGRKINPSVKDIANFQHEGGFPCPCTMSWLIFMPTDGMIRGILFLSCLFVCLSICLSVCVSVCVSVCLSVVKFYLPYKFGTVRDRDFIFCMHTPLMMPF